MLRSRIFGSPLIRRLENVRLGGGAPVPPPTTAVAAAPADVRIKAYDATATG